MAENHSMDATRRYRPFFAVVGITKLTGTGNTAEYFAAIGWGQWFRYVTGSLDLLGVALLFSRRLTCYGAIVIAFSAGLATLISLTVLQGNPVWGTLDMVFVPLIITMLAIIPAWLTRPA
jgi:putative oxidoreductase